MTLLVLFYLEEFYDTKNLSTYLYECTPDVTRTHNLRLRRTLLAIEQQSLIVSSDLRVTIFCPGLSHNADFHELGTGEIVCHN